MTKKEEFLKLKTYEEYEKKKERFKGIEYDDVIHKHWLEILESGVPLIKKKE